MLYSLYIVFLSSFVLSADIVVDISPDTIFVGSKATISVRVENMNQDEIALFHDFNDESDNYSLIDKKLYKNSSSYTIQFWNSGNIIIPSFIIDIKQFNHNIIELKTAELRLDILSNITNQNSSLRDIKNMQDIKLTSLTMKIFYIIFIFSGFITAIVLWNKRSKPILSQFIKGDYCKTGLNDTLKAIDHLPFPKHIDLNSTEKFYLQLSKISRQFIKDQFYFKATEMTSNELLEHFKHIGIDKRLVELWHTLSSKADLVKYAKLVPPIEEYKVDKLNFINLIKSLNDISTKFPSNSSGI